MREHPMLFSAPMVRRLLADVEPKTQTRRIVKLPGDRGAWEPTTVGGPGCHTSRGEPVPEMVAIWNTTTGTIIAAPYQAGDRLWGRETHAQFAVGNRTGTAPQCVAYRATCDDDGSFDYVNNGDEIMRIKVTKWTPAIFMPRWASRITLDVIGVRVQRLQEITEQDARAEGADPYVNGHGPITLAELRADPGYGHPNMYRQGFEFLWDSINGKRAAWTSNPWVWAVTFKRVPEVRP